jgi:hypothetical protein
LSTKELKARIKFSIKTVIRATNTIIKVEGEAISIEE